MAPYWAAGASGFGTGSNLTIRERVRMMYAPWPRPTPPRSAHCLHADATVLYARQEKHEMAQPRSSTPAILALGEAMVEFNQARAGTPDDYLRGFGGDTSNMAIAGGATHRGAVVTFGYATRVGNDAFGRMLLDLWQREGVDTRGVATDAGAPTGVYFS